MHKARHSPVAVKIGVKVSQVEMDGRGLEEIIHRTVLLDERHEPIDILRKFFKWQSGMLNALANNIHSIMPIVLTGIKRFIASEKLQCNYYSIDLARA